MKRNVSKFFKAVDAGDEIKIGAMLDAGADVNARCKHGDTALIHALVNYNSSLVEFLIQHGADVDLCDENGHAPVSYAIWAPEEPFNLLNILLRAGANPNVWDWHGMTPLMVAALYREEDCLHALLDAGSWVNGCDIFYTTPLRLAKLRGIEQAVKILKAAGGKNFKPRVPKGYDANQPLNKYGGTPLYSAIGHHDTELAHALLDAGAKANPAPGCNRFPLTRAVVMGTPRRAKKMALVRRLIQEGADVNADTPLHWAVRGGDVEMVRELLAAGADVNVVHDCGETALMWAAEHGNEANVRLLLRAGADPRVKNKKGETAADMARKKSHAAVAAILDEAAGG